VVGGLGGLLDRLLYVAQDTGLLREQGIEVEYVPVTSTVQAAPILATGQMDVLSSGTSAGLWNAVARDIAIKVVSDVSPMPPGQRNSSTVMAGIDLAPTLHDYSDLLGKTFAINQKAQVNHVQLGRMLQLGGLQERDITLLEVPFPDQVAAFRNRVIDLAISVEPLATTMEDNGVASRWREVGDFYSGQIVQYLLYSAPFIQERRDLALRYFIAHIQAARYFDAAFSKGINRDEVISILVDHGTIKDRKLYERIGPSYATELNGRVSVDSLMDEQDFYLRNGFMNARLDPSQIVDPSFGEDTVRILGLARN
jgi:NitT/TauT family transport system substrate-binding protein